MLQGKILAGEENVSLDGREARWLGDTFPELYNDDTLWAYMIRVSDELEFKELLGPEAVQDKVLRRLLKMGCWDWEDQEHLLNQTVPAVRHATAMVSRIIPRIFKLEKKVRKEQEGMCAFLILSL